MQPKNKGLRKHLVRMWFCLPAFEQAKIKDLPKHDVLLSKLLSRLTLRVCLNHTVVFEAFEQAKIKGLPKHVVLLSKRLT